MAEWLQWLIVAAIGLVAAIVMHALIRQAWGGLFAGTFLFGILGAFIAAWLLPRFVNIPQLALFEERFLWAALGGLVLALIYELATAGSDVHRSRILIPAPGRR